MTPREIAEKYVYGRHNALTDKQEIEDMVKDIESCLIDYIENDAEIAIPIDELMHEEGRHLTKKEYGKVLIKYLVKELRERYR